MDAITTDMDGKPITIGTVVETDKTVSVPTRVGSVTEVMFRQEGVMLRVTGVRGYVENVHVSCVDLTEFEAMVFNAFSERKAYLTKEETHALAKAFKEALVGASDEELIG